MKHSLLFLLIAIVCTSVKSEQNVEQRLNKYLDDLENQKHLYLIGGLRLDKIETARSLSSIENSNLVHRFTKFFETHELNFEIPSKSTLVTEARSSKLKKLALPLLLALKLKFSVFLPIVLKALALVSVKGLTLGVLSLILSSVTFFKDFFGKKQERITTAYITAPGPVHAELVDGWNRNGLEQQSPQELAYNSYVNPYDDFHAHATNQYP